MTTAQLDAIHLARGNHSDPDNGLCLLEAVAFIAGERHSGHPQCVSTVLGAFGRRLNDVLPDDLRQDLKPLIPSLIGTRGDGHDETRSLMALDWLIRAWLPAWLQLVHLDDEARALRELTQIVDLDTAQAVGPIVREARDKARGKRVAVWGAARDAARDAAGDVARDAAGVAAWGAARVAVWGAVWGAAWGAAGVAVWGAVWGAARDAAGVAVWGAARDAAGVAVWGAARDAAEDAAGDAAGDVAWVAARDALQPTVTELQRSAIDLFRRMATVS